MMVWCHHIWFSVLIKIKRTQHRTVYEEFYLKKKTNLPLQKLQAMILGPELEIRLPEVCLFGTVEDRLR